MVAVSASVLCFSLQRCLLTAENYPWPVLQHRAHQAVWGSRRQGKEQIAKGLDFLSQVAGVVNLCFSTPHFRFFCNLVNTDKPQTLLVPYNKRWLLDTNEFRDGWGVTLQDFKISKCVILICLIKESFKYPWKPAFTFSSGALVINKILDCEGISKIYLVFLISAANSFPQLSP